MPLAPALIQRLAKLMMLGEFLSLEFLSKANLFRFTLSAVIFVSMEIDLFDVIDKV